MKRSSYIYQFILLVVLVLFFGGFIHVMQLMGDSKIGAIETMATIGLAISWRSEIRHEERISKLENEVRRLQEGK